MMRAFTLNVKRATGEVESLNYAFRQITDNNGNVTDTYFENTSSHLNDSGAIKQIYAIEKAFSDYTTKIAKFKSTNAEILSGLNTPLKDFETKLAGLKTGASTVNEVKSAFNSLNTEAAKITQNFSKQLSPIDRAVSKIANGSETIKGLRADLKGLDNAPKDLSKELNQCAKELQKVKDIEANEGRTENWSKAYKQWAESIDAVTSKIKTLKKEQSNVASTQVFNTSDLKANRQAIDSFKVWVSATTVVMGAVNLIRQIPTVVNELDTALVDLRKTTTMTDAQLKEFYTDAPNIAKQMGVGTKAIIDQASAWSRLGYSSKDAATKMAKYSAMFKTISPGMNLDDATDGLVSVMKAFNIGNENVDDVVDGIMSKINIVGNTQAVDNSDIVNFLTRSSSAMAEANNTLEQTIALGTAATEITRDSDSVGNALKTISMRVRGYDEETEAYTGDVEQLSGVIANLTKTAKTPGGISLFTDSSKQTFKSTYVLLKEISQIYSQLSDKNQAQLLEALAGKRQGQIVASIIDNFSAAEKSMDSMANSAGNAQAEMDVSMDSIDAKANKLKQTGVAISENLLSRDNAKTVLEVANGIAGGFELATKHLGLFKTALLSLSVVGSVKNIGLFKTTKNDSETSLSGQKIVTAFTSRKIAQEEAAKQTALDIECLQRYEAECQKGSVSTETFATTMKGASVEAQKYAVNIKNGTGSAQTFATNQKAIQTSVTKTGVASKVAAVGLNIFKTALNMGIMLGVSELITGVIELATYSDKLADSAQSLGNDFKDSENDISDYKDRIQELNDKINDSSTPYDEVIQARKDLMTIQNEMIEKYGDEKGAIEDITNAVKGQADAFNNLNMTQYNKMVNDFNKTGGIVGKIQNAFVGSNFEQMKKNEKSYSDKIDMSYNSELDNYIKSLGAKQVISDRGSYFELNGALQEVYEKMQSIQEVANQLGEDKYANRLSDQINDAQELTDKYKDGQFVYSTDNSAIRDAQDSLHDAQYDVDVANLKKQQDDIDNYIDTLNEFKDKWNEISDAFSEAQDTMNLKQYLGSEYQRIILSNNLADIENFKNQYVAVESQINSNEQLKTSYEEKVDYYNNLKQQWEDCTSKYDDEMNKLYASQILGANWESEVLSGRLQTLTNFTSEYEKLCQRQADAAVNAANTEVQASKNAAAGVTSTSSSVASSGSGSSSGGSSSSTSSAPKVTYDKNNNPNKPNLVSNDYWTYEKLSKGYSTSGQASSHISDYASKGANGFTQIGNKYFIVKWIANAGTPANASKAKNKLEKDHPKKIGKYGYAKRYHKGLELGKIEALPKDKAFDLVQDVGINGLKADEVPIIAQKREAVLTEEQIENLAKTLHLVPVQNEIMEKMSKISLGDLPMNTPKMNFDTGKVGQNVTKNNFAPSVNITFNCPNLTNESGVKYVEKAMDKYMNKFANDFYQASLHYVNRKQ